jgi:hypothetical protein
MLRAIALALRVFMLRAIALALRVFMLRAIALALPLSAACITFSRPRLRKRVFRQRDWIEKQSISRLA